MVFVVFVLCNAACCLAAFASYTSWLRCCSVWLLCCCCVCYWNPSWSVRITRNCTSRVKTTKRSWCWGCQLLSFSCWRYTLLLNLSGHWLRHHLCKVAIHVLLFLLQVTEFLDVSMELGCFLAGALLSTQGHMVTADVMGCVEPIRDFLAIIFFASIGQTHTHTHSVADIGFDDVVLWFLVFLFRDGFAGFHVFPTFVLYELTILLVLTLTLVIMKVQSCAQAHLSQALPPSSGDFTPPFLSVHDGRAGAVGDLASGLAAHPMGGFSRSGSGQRILLRVEQPCASCWHHFKRGQW